MPTLAALARSCWLHANRPRAALHWAESIMPGPNAGFVAPPQIHKKSMDFYEDKLYKQRNTMLREIAVNLRLGSERRTFIGGSDARIIMGDDEEPLLRLWREKRGAVEPEDLSGDLLVQLGTVTEDLNRHWFE